MFKKPYSTKDKSNLRNSKRRKILARLPENVSAVLSTEKNIYAQRVQAGLKLYNIYGGEKFPLFFDIQYDDVLYPTVYTLWRCHGAYPTLLVHAPVIEKLQGGADLMLPGVINAGDTLPTDIIVGAPVAISTLSSATNTVVGPVMVGKALLSSAEMLTSGMKGRGVQILHFYRDSLWDAGDKSHPPSITLNEFEAIHFTDRIDSEETVAHELSTKQVDELSTTTTLDSRVDEPLENDLENVLRKTFLAAVRYQVQSQVQFPVDAGQFYATFVLKNLPSGVRMDLKRTKYKKFSTFLRTVDEECGEEWLVRVSTNKKGIDAIEKLNFEHPLVKSAEFLSSGDETTNPLTTTTHRIRVSDCFSVTEAVMPLLRLVSDNSKHFRKGDILQSNELRDVVIDYAKKHNLSRDNDKKVELDDALQMAVKHFVTDTLPVNDVVQRISAQMTKCSVVSKDSDASFRKVYCGSMLCVEMKMEKRSGNKVVTLINHLSIFGIDERLLCQRIQAGQATGTTIISTAPNCQGAQVLAHGNVINFVGDELMNTYGLQKKYIKGLELGVKEKKKKK